MGELERRLSASEGMEGRDELIVEAMKVCQQRPCRVQGQVEWAGLTGKVQGVRSSGQWGSVGRRPTPTWPSDVHFLMSSSNPACDPTANGKPAPDCNPDDNDIL